jgi:hypothetical protein
MSVLAPSRLWRQPASPTVGTRTIALLSPAIGTSNAGDHFIEAAVRRLLPDARFERLSTRRELTRREIALVNSTDAVVICGTNLYQAHWTAPALGKAALRRIKVPIVPLGIGTSSRESDDISVPSEVADIIRRIHAKCEVSSARDPATVTFLHNLGISNVRLTGCPVLHWRGEAAIPRPQPGTRKRLVISPRNWLMHHDEPIDHPSTIALLTSVLSAFPGADVRYVIHEEVDVRLAERLGLDAQAVWPQSTEEYVDVYSDPDSAVLACRLHGGMIAAANGVPAVFIGHDSRTYSFCDLVDLPCVRQLDRDAPAQAVARMRSVLAGDMTDVTIAQSTYAALREQMNAFLSANGLVN